MVFDQYQRYETISRMISIIKRQEETEKFKILEVGANAQKTLSNFISDEIFFTDIQEIEELKDDDHFFVADATNLDGIENDEYDIVVASDVFEHVPRQLRDAFLSEIYRVSKYGVIMCFPIGNEVTEAAERKVNERYKELFGEDHRWLIEHIENGLPVLADVEKVFGKNNIEYVKIEHGNIDIWEKFQTASLDMLAIQQYVKIQKIDDIYNRNIYESDFGRNNYRVFYFLNKKLGDPKMLISELLNSFEQKETSEKYLRQMEEV